MNLNDILLEEYLFSILKDKDSESSKGIQRIMKRLADEYPQAQKRLEQLQDEYEEHCDNLLILAFQAGVKMGCDPYTAMFGQEEQR